MTPQEKNREQCSAYYAANLEKSLEQRKAHYVANKEKILRQRKVYYARNREALIEKERRYYSDNKKSIMARRKNRHNTDPPCRLQHNLRVRVRDALRGRGARSSRTFGLVGCSTKALRQHLEKQFVSGMTWENYGSVWHVDHILPCAKFHLQHSEEQEICFNWSNLQPLFVKDNLSKSDKII